MNINNPRLNILAKKYNVDPTKPRIIKIFNLSEQYAKKFLFSHNFKYDDLVEEFFKDITQV